MKSSTRSVLSVVCSTGTLPFTVVTRDELELRMQRREHDRDGVVGARVDVEDHLLRHRPTVTAPTDEFRRPGRSNTTSRPIGGGERAKDRRVRVAVPRRGRRGPGYVLHRLGRRDGRQPRRRDRDAGRGHPRPPQLRRVGGFWPSSDIEPFATFINGVTKYVATSTPLDREWANATAIDGGLVEFVRDLKEQPGGDIGVHASISVAQSLLAADVVDELRLVIAPRIAGRGRRLLDGLPSIRLESIRSEISPTGYLLVDYRVSRSADDAPQSRYFAYRTARAPDRTRARRRSFSARRPTFAR